LSSKSTHFPGLLRLTAAFLALSVPIETVYSWQLGLLDPYYLVKVSGWLLLVAGLAQVRLARFQLALILFGAGWAWLGANFWRAVADRFTRLAAGQTLRLGSVEIWFAAGCLLVSLIGLTWSIGVAVRNEATPVPPTSD
jgi:hypothetical protein